MTSKYKRLFNFVNNYVDDARLDTPDWLINKRFKCIECGFQPIYLKEEFCPFCKINNRDTPNNVSLNIGISILGWLEEYNFQRDDNANIEKAKENIRRAIISALPIVNHYESDYPSCMYISKTGVCINDALCDELSDYYLSEYNENSCASQHINKISIRKLFGYHSYDLNFSNDLSIIYGSNGLGKTTLFKLLECIFICPQYDGPMSDTINEHKISERIDYLLDIPFESIRIDFNSGDGLLVLKTRSENDECELSFSYTHYGYDSIMSISGIGKKEQTTFGSNRLAEMKTHYDNINKLFPNINNYNKFLFVKVNRYSDLDRNILGLKRRFTFNGPTAFSKSDELIKYLDFLNKPSIFFDFDNNLQSAVNTFNKSLDKEFPLLKSSQTKRVFDFTKDELFDYLVSNSKQSIITDIEKEKHVLTRKPIDDYLHSIKKEKEIKEKELVVLADIYAKTQTDSQDIKKHRITMLDFILESRSIVGGFSSSKLSLFAIRQIIKFYRNFELLKELFENLYYEHDPSRKQLTYSNGLTVKANTSLNGDFSKELPIDALSSGEINILTILYNLIFNTEGSSILLIDEPEISLHVAWQQQFADLVKQVMNHHPGMQVVIASHSPFLTSGHDEYFVGADLVKEEDD